MPIALSKGNVFANIVKNPGIFYWNTPKIQVYNRFKKKKTNIRFLLKNTLLKMSESVCNINLTRGRINC